VITFIDFVNGPERGFKALQNTQERDVAEYINSEAAAATSAAAIAHLLGCHRSTGAACRGSVSYNYLVTNEIQRWLPNAEQAMVPGAAYPSGWGDTPASTRAGRVYLTASKRLHGASAYDHALDLVRTMHRDCIVISARDVFGSRSSSLEQRERVLAGGPGFMP